MRGSDVASGPISLAVRLEDLEMQAAASHGYIKALEYGLHAIIATHPAPEALAELRSHLIPEVTDIHGAGATGAPLLDAAFQKALSGLSKGQHTERSMERGQPGQALAGQRWPHHVARVELLAPTPQHDVVLDPLQLLRHLPPQRLLMSQRP